MAMRYKVNCSVYLNFYREKNVFLEKIPRCPEHNLKSTTDLGSMGKPIFLQHKMLTAAKNSNEFICRATQRNGFFHTSMKSSCAHKVVKTLFKFMNKFKDIFFL